MAESRAPGEVRWYRVPLDREVLRGLTARSDLLGFLQAGGFLLLLAASAAAAWLAWGRAPLYVLLPLLFLHGTFFVFLNNGFHELVHGTVFRTRALNWLFLRLYAFLGWNSHVAFKASHTRHHLSTLHPPGDLEVVLPVRLTPAGFLLFAVVDVLGVWGTLRDTVRLASGRVHGEWMHAIFPATDQPARRALFRWARVTLAGHAAVIAVSAATGLWQLAVLVSAAHFYGGWLHWLCNNTQHAGLQDNVDDFRLCCRTVHLGPVTRFLYFHMNFHVEHHMYASVPCYRLGALRRALGPAVPPARGLAAAWKEIIGIQRRQRREPGYQHVVPLPGEAAAGGSRG